MHPATHPAAAAVAGQRSPGQEWGLPHAFWFYRLFHRRFTNTSLDLGVLGSSANGFNSDRHPRQDWAPLPHCRGKLLLHRKTTRGRTRDPDTEHLLQSIAGHATLLTRGRRKPACSNSVVWSCFFVTSPRQYGTNTGSGTVYGFLVRIRRCYCVLQQSHSQL